MMVYRAPKRTVSGLEWQGDATRYLIECGELEAALVDRMCPERDEWTPEIARLRELTRNAGRAFCLKHREPAAYHLDAPMEVTVPEGFAYYGLYPEMYRDAARRFAREVRPQHVVVIGIRSIGTALSAVVAAALEQCGSRVETFTVRPQGHPFDRELRLSQTLERRWRESSHAHFTIVDEGPGLSGSSFASVAAKLAELGIPDRRILLFPSWAPDGESFVSQKARDRWRRHAKYVGQFQPQRGLQDISAGEWRCVFCSDDSEHPAVQPQHEARKYLSSGSRRRLFKFAGLGPYGEPKLRMAERLAEAGFTPRPVALRNGLLETEVAPGQPLNAGASDQDLCETMARYLAFRRREFVTRPGVKLPELACMIETNAGIAPPELPEPAAAVAIDGHMAPHEWIATPRGYLKTDALDHHDNHFLPGSTDIAWDLAGAAIEFAMSREQRRAFIALYTAHSGDYGAWSRLPFFIAAYAAFRLGYCTLAEKALGPGKDRTRFRSLQGRYRTYLGREASASA
jgi:hypothetical protein